MGGVETLFMDSSDIVMQYAANAYQTAGLSANDYMNTVTSFSASLLQGLGGDTEQAAEIANLAITDMSDNANKMGTDMEAIQNAYQGFAKQNYTMLDNLKLGYGGTQAEMVRLINDSGILEEKIDSMDGITFDQMIQAIHVVQTEMGITGTTALEASTTIEGSLNSAKAAWSNLLVGIADDSQDFDTLVENFVDSVVTAADNLIPRIETSITGLGNLIEKLLPVIVEEIPGIVNDILPELVESGINMIQSILNGIEQNLPQIMEGALLIVNQLISAFLEMLPQLLDIGVQIILQLILGISESFPELVPVIIDAILTITDTLTSNAGLLVDAAIQLMSGLAEGFIAALPILTSAFLEMLPKFIEMGAQVILQILLGISEALPTLIPAIVEAVLLITETLIENIDLLVDAAIQLISGLAEGLIAALPILIEKAPEIIIKLVDAIVENAPKLLEAAYEILTKLNEGLETYLPQLLAAIPDLVIALVNKFLSLASKFIEIGKKFISQIKDAIVNKWEELKGFVPEWVNSLIQNFVNMISGFSEIGSNIVHGIWNGISAGWDWLIGNVKNLASSLLDAAKSTLGIHSPSREFAYLGRMCTAGFEEGINGLMDPDGISRNVSASLGSIRANMEGTSTGGNYGTYTQVVNVNREISTPDELARALRVENRLGLIRGYGPWAPGLA